MSTISRAGAAFLIGLLVCLAAIWFWVGGSGTDAQDAVTIDAGETQEQPAGKRADAIGGEPAGNAEDGEKAQPSNEDAARTQLLEDRTARIKGRCVTIKNMPIGDCTVSGKRYQTNTQQEAKRSGGRPESVPPGKTDEDGYFELQFRPAENWSYSLHFAAKGHAYYRGELGEVRPGETRDVGEIVLLAGARVRGRVVDDQGVPVAGCELGVSMNPRQFAALASSDPKYYPHTSMTTKTDSVGRFALPSALRAGVWDLNLAREKISPKEILIPENRNEIDIEIRVRSLEDKDQIRGHVFDQDARPVHGAELEYYPRASSGRFGFQYRIYTQNDGSFRILRSKTDTGVPVRLRIDKKGFDRLNTKKPIQWGTSGLRLVMTRGTALSIHALDAETRKPVENYGLKIRSLGGRGTQMGVQRGGKHKDGILRLSGMARGRYKIMVVPEESHPEKSHLASQWKEVEVTAVEGTPLLVELHQAVEQKLLVITAKGEPVVGTKVELLEAYQGHPIDANTFIQTANHTTTSANRARLWKRGRTDDTGTLWLSGPPARELGLRIRGPGHVPLCTGGIRLEKNGGVITVTVKIGASLAGRIHPPEALRALDTLGSQIAKGVLGRGGLSSKAGLKLSREHPAASYPQAWGKRFPIGKDGSFRIVGIAPGSWTLQLIWIRDIGGGRVPQLLNLQMLDNLQEGEERKLDLDISRFLLGEAKGTVLWNGSPAKGATIRLQTRNDSHPPSQPATFYASVKLDDDGRFSTQLVPALYDCLVRLKTKRGRFQSLYPTGSVLRVTAGGKHEIRLDVHTAKLVLHFKDHDGKPLPGLRAFLVPTGSKTRFYLPASDGDGNCTERIPSGSQSLLLPPKHLSTFEGTRAFRKVHGQGYSAAYTKALIPLDTLNLTPGSKPEPIQITVPKSAGY